MKKEKKQGEDINFEGENVWEEEVRENERKLGVVWDWDAISFKLQLLWKEKL